MTLGEIRPGPDRFLGMGQRFGQITLPMVQNAHEVPGLGPLRVGLDYLLINCAGLIQAPGLVQRQTLAQILSGVSQVPPPGDCSARTKSTIT